MIQVVCVKQVPDTETRVKVAADGRSLDPAGVTWVLNPYDEYAVEQALRVRDQQGGGEVVVVSVGGPGVLSALRNVLALGADRAIHLRTDVTAPDPLSLSARWSPSCVAWAPGCSGSASRRWTTTRPRWAR